MRKINMYSKPRKRNTYNKINFVVNIIFMSSIT